MLGIMLIERTAIGPAVAVADATPPVRRYILSATFDVTLLAAPFLTGIVAGLAALANPALFPLLLIADIWLLGYQHVVATYTRLAFDTRSLRENRFLAVDLLIIVTLVTVAATVWIGAWFIATAFLYLQWFHYMRQGYGLARMYYRTTDRSQSGHRDYVTDAVIYLVPVFGILQRSATLGDTFLGSPVKAIVVPSALITIVGAGAAVAVAVWAARIGLEAVQGRLDGPYHAFVGSHVAMFAFAYVVVADVNIGWLAINVWHNFQYVLVVWMVNTKRFAKGIDPQARFLSTISQPGRTLAYFAACLAISTFVYLNLFQITAVMLGGGLAASLGVYMGINFHHYVVDGLIWKRRRTRSQVA